MYGNFQPPEPADIGEAMGLLAHLNIDELKEILNDDNKCEEMMKDLKQVKKLESDREMLLVSNRSLADFNLTYEPRLEAGKQRLRQSTERAQELCLSVQTKATELANKSGNLSLDSALALLETAASESEEESEAIAAQYLSTEIDLEEFLEKFQAKRRIMHLRRVKADKMAEILSSSGHTEAPPLPARAPYPAMNAAPYPSINATPYPPISATPYPSVPYPNASPLNMPHPQF